MGQDKHGLLVIPVLSAVLLFFLPNSPLRLVTVPLLEAIIPSSLLDPHCCIYTLY